jgi:hypothetical protein
MLVSAITRRCNGTAASFTFRATEAIMKTTLAMISVFVASVLCLPAVAAAQGDVTAFDQLNTRLKLGNTVRVTDNDGREVKGTLTELSDTSITVNSGVPTTFEAGRVRGIRKGDGKSFRRPVTWGMLIGGVVVGAAGAHFAVAHNGGEAVGAVFLWGGTIGLGIGAGGGAILGAALPAKWKEVYRAPGASGGARVSVAPMITPRAKGVVLSLSF